MTVQQTQRLISPTDAIQIRPIGVRASELEASLRHCRQITQREARNFYYGLKLTPEPRRSALYAIYAWMRRADDEADSAAVIEARRVGLARLRDQTERALSGDPPRNSDPMWPALTATMAAYPIRAEWLADVLDAMDEDIEGFHCVDDDQLDRYCYQVASTVGMICVSIWGLRDPADTQRALELAATRGTAFQLTNILRDFVEDYDGSPRRVYLPEQSFRAMDLTPVRLRAWDPPSRCEEFVNAWIDRARQVYVLSAGLESLIAPDCVPVLNAMTRIYRDLLERIAREPHRIVLGGRISIPRVRKVRIALSAAFARTKA